jgi:hypothetical protein
MSLKRTLLFVFVPAAVKKSLLRELFEFTAYAFACAPPQTGELSYTGLLARYAEFSKEEAEKAIGKGDGLGEIKQRLFENARLLGQKFKARYRLGTLKDAFGMARVLFRILRIDFQGNPSGEIVVRRCFFSSRFSKEVCSIVSSFDEGLLAGLSGGAVLTSFERTADCSSCCKARFVFKDTPDRKYL